MKKPTRGEFEQSAIEATRLANIGSAIIHNLLAERALEDSIIDGFVKDQNFSDAVHEIRSKRVKY
jgi:hypothetical protein